jgi:hypothetical protein
MKRQYYINKVPRERRLCRFCNLGIESPEHALSLQCTLDRDTVELRRDFRDKIRKIKPDWDPDVPPH